MFNSLRSCPRYRRGRYDRAFERAMAAPFILR
jgi:hypothetical protein